MYEPKHDNKANAVIDSPSPEIGNSALQEVEQEREVAFEIESIRAVQKPVHYTPYKFRGLYKDLVTFVNTGRVLVSTEGYEPVFLALRRSCSLGAKYSIDFNAASGLLYSSVEFSKTVHLNRRTKFNDNFQRPVNWILISRTTNIAIIVTPEEAENLIPHLNTKSRRSPVHLIIYAAPTTRKMIKFDTLRFLSILPLPEEWKPPSKLSVELGIVAGRLYFPFEHFSDLKDYFGLTNEDAGENMTADASGVSGNPIFAEKPLSFLQEWLTLKRKGQDFLHTPIGYICQGKNLLDSHPFFTDGSPDEVAVVERKLKGLDLDPQNVDKMSETAVKEI
ncbi:uncharacterized protein DFL_005787 [Arthrobotrys flagrans]|uniref:Uncharacterized protein n=1 Tax=Arthrobotrys flagrans TaxID=97331 RepID=A0A436ZYJ0_ARTFL|nr:hypothetical protein DFL_005787 [Arthrobotrys flagrans]